MQGAVVSRSRENSRKEPKVWGRGSFDNDAAMGWVEQLEDAADFELLEATLEEVIEAEEEGRVPGPETSAHAIAAAETVAALVERSLTGLPEEVRQWCFDTMAQDLRELQPTALQALGVLLTDSWIRDFFEEHGEADAWEAEVEALRDRLR